MTSSESHQNRFGYRFFKIKREATLAHKHTILLLHILLYPAALPLSQDIYI